LGLPKVFFVEVEFVAFEEWDEFVFEGVAAVVFFLFGDVVADGVELRMTHAEGGVSALPGELRIEFTTKPAGRVRFELAQEVGRCLWRWEEQEVVDVFEAPVDDEGAAALVLDGGGQVGVKAVPDGGG
jgi:hypothetical protein